MNVRSAHLSLNARRMSADGLPCVYRRGDQSVEVRALRGRSLMRLSTPSGGQKTELWDCDWFVTAALLVLDGVRIDPKSGDLADVTIDSEVVRFEVSAPSKEEPPARKVDSDLAWRIHTKRLKVVMGY